MFKNKKRACAFFFILTLFWPAYGADDDYSQYTTSSRSQLQKAGDISEVPHQSFEDAGMSIERNNLEELFTPERRVQIPETARQVVSGMASLVPLFPTGQIFVPTALIGLNSLGLTKYIVPDVGWESWLLVTGIAIPIAVAALISTYNGASQFFKPISSDIIETQKQAFEQKYSWWESGSRCYPTQFVQLAFWGGLFFALLMNTESRVTGWGDYRILGSIFGTLALIPIYFIFVRETNDINKYTYRRSSKHEEDRRVACLRPVEEAKEKIKDYGLTNEVDELGAELNVIMRPFSMGMVNSQDEERDDAPHVSPLLANDRDSSNTVLLNDLTKPEYLRIFEQTKTLSLTTSPWIKNWNFWSTKISKHSSRVAQILSIPAEFLVSYALPYSLCTYLGAPSGVSIAVGAVTAAVYGVALPFISIKENGLIWKEYEQALRLFKPQVTCGYFGERIAPVIARLLTLTYVTFPVTDFIRHSLFEQAIGITNTPAQILILIPFMAGAGFAAPAQFLDRAYTTLANWVATGGRVTLPAFGYDRNYSFKLFCLCCGSDKNDREMAIEILERLNEIENKIAQLSSGSLKDLALGLGINILSGDDSPLLEHVSLQ